MTYTVRIAGELNIEACDLDEWLVTGVDCSNNPISGALDSSPIVIPGTGITTLEVSWTANKGNLCDLTFEVYIDGVAYDSNDPWFLTDFRAD